MKYENVSVMNFDNAIRGMRNPMSSQAKSDSINGEMQWRYLDSYDQPKCIIPILGETDYNLARTLIKGGGPHRKFLRQILVSVDICKMPLKLMLEFDTYKVGTVSDCSSTMHKITSRKLTKDDFCPTETPLENWHLGDTIETLNFMREQYLACKRDGEELEAEKYFRGIKNSLPAGYLYERMTWTANYEVLSNIWYWRHTHRLPEWHDFCENFIERLPYSEFITQEFGDEDDDTE